MSAYTLLNQIKQYHKCKGSCYLNFLNDVSFYTLLNSGNKILTVNGKLLSLFEIEIDILYGSN